MESQESDNLTGLVGNAADSAQIAEVMAATWQKIDTTLSPIIGHGGVAALYKRSLYLTAPHYPWLADIHAVMQKNIDILVLKKTLKQQSSGDAAAGSSALLQTFHELLANLIGSALTERLLHTVWQTLTPISGQDPSL